MKNIKKLLSVFLLLLVCSLSCYSQKYYKITEEQYQELVQIQNTLETNYDNQTKILKEQVKDWEKSYKKLKRQNSLMTISVGITSFGIGAAATAILIAVYK